VYLKHYIEQTKTIQQNEVHHSIWR